MAAHRNYLTANSGRGRELALALMDELGVPATASSFSVHFDVDGFITVQCEYAALVKDAPVQREGHPCGD